MEGVGPDVTQMIGSGTGSGSPGGSGSGGGNGSGPGTPGCGGRGRWEPMFSPYPFGPTRKQRADSGLRNQVCGDARRGTVLL